MRPGSHMTDEQRARCSLAKMGNTDSLGCHHSKETKVKMSAALMGNKRALGYHHSEETKTKISAGSKGHKVSLEVRAKIAAAQRGDICCHWKGGSQFSNRRTYARRRSFGYVYLNAPFIDCEGHHIDNEQVIHMPHMLHRSVFHRQTGGCGMAKINAIAYNFLLKQEVAAAMGELSLAVAA